MDDDELLYRLLHRALVEIRGAGHESSNKIVYHLANLFHRAALELGQAARGELDHAEVMARLSRRAHEMGCERWLTDRRRELEARQVDKTEGVPDE
jgi:hypothetical protein